MLTSFNNPNWLYSSKDLKEFNKRYDNLSKNCGNNIVDPGEECDAGNNFDKCCDSTCFLKKCLKIEYQSDEPTQTTNCNTNISSKEFVYEEKSNFSKRLCTLDEFFKNCNGTGLKCNNCDGLLESEKHKLQPLEDDLTHYMASPFSTPFYWPCFFILPFYILIAALF